MPSLNIKDYIMAAISVVGAGLAIALWLTSNALETKRDELSDCKAAHKITAASVETLEVALANKNAESAARNQAFLDSQNKAAQDLDANAALYEATQARIEALTAKIGQGDACLTPDVGEL